jgi:hypothetical protein
VTRAEYEAEIERRQRTVNAAGLAQCEWMAAHATFAAAPDVRTVKRLVAEVKAHIATCPICNARNEYAEAHFGTMPAQPRSLGDRLLLALASLPEWSQPAVGGAIGIGGIVALRVVFAAVPARIGLAAIGLGMFGGAAAGLTFTLTRPLLKRLGTVGDYLTGVVVMAGYMGAFLVMFSVLPGKPLIASPSDAVVYLLITVGFGLFGAHQWRRNNRQPS